MVVQMPTSQLQPYQSQQQTPQPYRPGFVLDMNHLLQTIQNCEAHCAHSLSIILSGEIRGRNNQIRYLSECEGICRTTAKFIAWESGWAPYLAGICADICEACASECRIFPDEVSQRCSEICFRCSRVCAQFAQYISGHEE